MHSSYPPPPPQRASAAPPAATTSPPPPARRRRAGLIIGLILLFGVFGAVMFAGYLFFRTPTVEVEHGTWLDLRFDASYPEERPYLRGLMGAMQGEVMSAQDLYSALLRAATDPRIDGVLLRPDFYRGGWAQAQEIRDLLMRIRNAGKPVWAYVQAPRSGAYYLASAADSIAVAPEGGVYILGLQARMMYLKGTLDKLGVAADYVAIGEYKSAPEQYQREGPSELARQQISAFVDDVYDSWIDGLAGGRGLSRGRMETLVDQGFFDADTALEQGLVDQVIDQRALWERLQPDQEKAKTIHPLDYLAADWDAPSVDRSAALALIYATGQIVPGHAESGSGFMGSSTVIDRLRRANRDERVKAIILRIDSPGGSALASDLIWREVERVREEKSIVISMGDIAASGGYYIAMSGDRILADPLTLTGSIGVYAGKMDLSGLYHKVGVSYDTIQRGQNAGMWNELQPFTPSQERELRRTLGSFYERFVARVASGREMPEEEANQVARGRIWSGRRAQEVGLVDELGGLYDAIREAKILAGLDPNTLVPMRTYQPAPSFFQRMMRDVFRDAGVAQTNDALPAWIEEGRAHLDVLQRTFDGSVQFRLPWSLRVE